MTEQELHRHDPANIPKVNLTLLSGFSPTSFLLELAGRLGTNDSIELPMPRRDIANYLGLTIETVSRTLSEPIAS
jgi:CRP-like cAMP-binding protein